MMMISSSFFSHSQLLILPQIHSFNPRNNGLLLHPHPHLHLSPTPRNCRLTVRNPTSPPPPLYSLHFSNPQLPPPPLLPHHGDGNNNDGNGGNRNNGGNNNWREDDNPFEAPDGGRWSPLLVILLSILTKLESDWMNRHKDQVLFLLSSVLSCFLFPLSPALALADPPLGDGGVWEVRGGKWTRLVPLADNADTFTVANHRHYQQQQKNDDGNGNGNGNDSGYSGGNKFYFQHAGLEYCWRQCRDLFLNLMLPEGYPQSVSSDYLEYSLWRGVQGIASQISGVLSTQSLLYAVGLGKGAIPTAAAVNWVLKDGLGYLSKILLSKLGRHFDVNPKGWRLFADLMENAAYGLEIITPPFPQYFVLIGAAAGAGRSAAALIQAATRSCFFANFAVQRNSAEVIAKGEAQGMVSKFLGIMLGIALANYIGSSTPLALATLSVVTGVHMYCNLKSYQSIQLKTLNPYRASLVFSEYLLSGQVPLIKEVNDEEPLFPDLPNVNLETHIGPSATLSVEAKYAAAEICRRLQLGYKFSEVVKNKEEAFALFDLFRNEGYMLTENRGRYCVILTEGCSPQDMLKSLFHVNYLYWLERNVVMEPKSITDECKPGGMLQISLDYVQREFGHIKQDGLQAGWLTDDGLIARPLPNRIRPVYADSNSTS